MNVIKILYVIFFIFITQHMFSLTWDEPWQEEVIEISDYFVLAEVKSYSDNSVNLEVEIIKNLSSKKLKGKINITGFSRLIVTSSSKGDHLKLAFEKGQKLYLFLSKNKKGFSIPTPTSGFAFLDKDNNVHATYRHSYHQALIPQKVYEETFTEIWNYKKLGTYNTNILTFINENLNKKPANFDKDQINDFFLQHAAMETAYHLGLEINFELIKGFLKFDNFHTKVSSLRVLSNSKDQKAKEYLLEVIQGDEIGNFNKVIAIWSLKEIGDKEYITKLIKVEDEISDIRQSFKSNLMDPRIGTHFPSPREAVKVLKKM